MHFRDNQELQDELDKMPSKEDLVFEDGIYWLKQEYAINRMNEIFGEGNWSIEKIRKSELKNEHGQVMGNVCVMTVSCKNPVDGDLRHMDGISGTGAELDNNIIGRAFLDAISHFGRTFGSELKNQFEE